MIILWTCCMYNGIKRSWFILSKNLLITRMQCYETFLKWTSTKQEKMSSAHPEPKVFPFGLLNTNILGIWSSPKMVKLYECWPRGSVSFLSSRKMILAAVIISLGGISHRIEGLASSWQANLEFWLDASRARVDNHATCEGWKLECTVADLYSMSWEFPCQPRNILPVLKCSVFLWLLQTL